MSGTLTGDVNVRGFVSRVDDVAAYLRAGLPDAVELIAGDLVAPVAAQLAPVDTGTLVSGIGATGGTVTADAPYSGYVHARTPFITDAWQRVEAEALDVMTDDVQRKLDTI